MPLICSSFSLETSQVLPGCQDRYCFIRRSLCLKKKFPLPFFHARLVILLVALLQPPRACSFPFILFSIGRDRRMEWKKEEEVGGEEEEKKKEAKVCEYFLSNFLSNLSYNERKIYFLTSEFSRIVIFCLFNFSKAGF